MQLLMDHAQVDAHSRLVLVALCSFTLRFMETGRKLIFDVTGVWPDYEVTMILTAVISIRAEKLLRADLHQGAERLVVPIDRGMLSACNVSGLAEAVGLSRETVRRRVGDLIEKKVLTKEVDGSLGIAPGLLELPEIREMVQQQVASMVRTANHLAAFRVITKSTGRPRAADEALTNSSAP